MKKRFHLLGILAVAPAVFGAAVLDIDFTASEGFSDGADIDNIAGMNAQGGWDAGDTAGTGYATCITSWNRARNYADFTLEIGGSVMIETTLRLTDADGTYADADSFEIGFAENAQHSGANTPSIGSTIHIFTDGSYWFGGDAAGNRISVSSADNGDWIKFTQTITRSAVSNEFIGTVSATNLTDGVDLGSTLSSWTESTDDGSWGGNMRPSFRSWANSQSTALEIDRWIVSTIEPPQQVSLQIDATRRRSIGGFTAMDRETWFGVYHETGYGTKTVDGKKIDEWIYEEGRMWPSRGTIGYSQFAEDPARDSFIDPVAISNYTGQLNRYVTAKGYDPDHKTVFSGRGHGDYPLYMCWPTNLTHNVPTVSNHVAHGEAVVRVFDRIEELGGLQPKWYEVMNESSIQNNFGWFWDSDAWDKLAEFHVGVADAVHASSFSNTVKVSGPTDAYPFRDGDDGDFSSWENGDKKFIHQTQNKMDAYGIHTYEQMNGKTSYEDYLERFEIWHLGRLPAFLDLWENEQFNTYGDTKPFVFSEYGLLNNTAGDTNAFYQLRSCNGILLSLLDRPDVVDKMSAFLMSWAPYDLSQKRVFFSSEDGGTTYHKTSYFEYLRFWRDLDGDYLFSSADTPHLEQHCFLDGGTNLFVVMQNNYKAPYLVDVTAALPAGASVVSAEKQRLYLADNDVARDPFAPIPTLGNIEIGADETVMLKIALSGMPALPVWEESNHYGDRTLVPMQTGVGEGFDVVLPSEAGKTYSAGDVTLGLYAFNGFSSGLQQVSVNGTVLTNLPDLSYTAGAPRHWAEVSLRVPEGVLHNGSNTVTVTPAEGEALMKITSVRLTSEAASDAVYNADRDLDGMSDAWEIFHGFNPADYTDGALDSDGDGFDNAAEYVCGTDPFDEHDFLAVDGIPNIGNGYRIAFDSKTGRVYAVEATADLRADWVDFTNGIPGTGGLIEVIDPATGETNRFYRIRAEVE